MSGIFYYLKAYSTRTAFKSPSLQIVLSQQIESLEPPLKITFHQLRFKKKESY